MQGAVCLHIAYFLLKRGPGSQIASIPHIFHISKTWSDHTPDRTLPSPGKGPCTPGSQHQTPCPAQRCPARPLFSVT